MGKERIEVVLRHNEGMATIPMSELNSLHYENQKMRRTIDAFQHHETIIRHNVYSRLTISTSDEDLNECLKMKDADIQQLESDNLKLKKEIKNLIEIPWYKFKKKRQQKEKLQTMMKL